MLSKEKTQKSINNPTRRHDTMVKYHNQQLGRSSFSLTQTCLHFFSIKIDDVMPLQLFLYNISGYHMFYHVI